MARSVKQIQTIITETYVANMAAIGVTINPATWSATNLQRLFIYTVAFCTYTLEVLFDTFIAEVNAIIAGLKPHTVRWYVNKALDFQYGFSLLPDSDLFDNTGHTADEIAASKIVKFAAVIEQQDSFNRVYLRMKLAGETGTDLSQLSEDEVAAFVEYMKRVKDAGVRLQIDSLPADAIRVKARCFYDPLILNNAGNRIDGQEDAPVTGAIKEYLKNLPFNGEYVTQYHEDYVQAVDGVVIFEIDQVETKYGLFPFSAVMTKITPDSGYLKFYDPADLDVEFIAQSPIR